jgi:hypothetical protein
MYSLQFFGICLPEAHPQVKNPLKVNVERRFAVDD